ncbi:hypothetical protein NQ176_g6481 [Zarea fungicola]|uniref:Uncharacterized protein n=1 Tax=Zarea fungicola TaxID=93591 RepID=A0ACC1N417_9HYPO|nr:hypothetical protein NQ176_g6481 [Lecanicillium fungicola]
MHTVLSKLYGRGLPSIWSAFTRNPSAASPPFVPTAVDVTLISDWHELITSARATLKLNLDDKSILANWDLVMITWAALVLLQGVKAGVGEPDDVQNIQAHINLLRESNLGEPCLRGKLATRLEQQFNSLHDSSLLEGPQQVVVNMNQNLNESWRLVDGALHEQVVNSYWMRPNVHQQAIPSYYHVEPADTGIY